MEPVPSGGPPMMTRVGGQLQSDSYDSILRQTEQDQRQPANGARQAPPPPPPQFQDTPEFAAQYNPNVPEAPQQTQNFAANMGPWAGIPGAQPAFEAPPDAHYQPAPPDASWPVQPPPAPAQPKFFKRYRDLLMVAFVVFVLYMYCVPQLGKFLPSVFQQHAGNAWSTAVLALTAGGSYHALNKQLGGH